MRIRLTTCLMILAAAGVSPAADPQLIGLAMPDAQFLAGAYPDRIPAPLQQLILSVFPPQSSAAVQLLLAAPGVDVNSIHEVLFATPDPLNTLGLVMARGTFDVTGITGTLSGQGQTLSDYNGVPLLTTADGSLALAFPDGSLGILGDPSTVTAALDRLTNATQPDPVLAGLADQLSAVQDIWAASIFRPDAPDPKSTAYDFTVAAMSKVKQSTAGIKLGGVVQWTAQFTMDTDNDASAMAGVVRLISGIAGAHAATAPVPLGAFIQKTTITVKGNTLSLSLSVPAADLQPAQAHVASTRK